MRKRAVLAFMALAAASTSGLACKSKASEPAPVVGGEYLQYRTEGVGGVADGKILIQPGDDGFIITTANTTGFEPQEVGLDLAAGRRQIKAFHLGMLWLAPSARKIGTELPIGKVLEQSVWNKVPVYVVGTAAVRTNRWYFHTETGFLVGNETAAGGGAYRTMLKSTDIPGVPTI